MTVPGRDLCAIIVILLENDRYGLVADIRYADIFPCPIADTDTDTDIHSLFY